MGLRRMAVRALVRALVRRDLRPERPLAQRRRAADHAARMLPLPRAVQSLPAAGVPAGSEWLLPPGGAAPDDGPGPAVLYLHGGGFVLGSPRSHRPAAARLALECGVPVLLLDYPLAPEHPFPAAPDAALAAWEALTRGGSRPVALAGDSAGGWLGLWLTLRAAALGLPQPRALALFSPLLDLAGAAARDRGDLLLPAGFVSAGVRAFCGAVPPGDPRFDLLDQPLAGLPPLFLAWDEDEMLAPDARRLAQAARATGVPVRAEAARGLWHAWPLFAGWLPEANATLKRAAAILAPHPVRAA